MKEKDTRGPEGMKSQMTEELSDTDEVSISSLEASTVIVPVKVDRSIATASHSSKQKKMSLGFVDQ